MIRNQLSKNYSKLSAASEDLYILSAVRTPLGLIQGFLKSFRASQLCGFACTEALLRGVVPPKDIRHVFLNCTFHDFQDREIIKQTGLKNTTQLNFFSSCGMRSLIGGIKFLRTSDFNVCLVGGVESMTAVTKLLTRTAIKYNRMNSNTGKTDLNQLYKVDYENYIKAHENGAFDEEILKIVFKKKGEIIQVDRDELIKNNEVFTSSNEDNPSFLNTIPGDGAAAVVIATSEYVTKNQLTPLAKIISYAEEVISPNETPFQKIQQALEVATGNQKISSWEIDSLFVDKLCSFVDHFDISSSLLNKDGGYFSLGYPMGTSGVRNICHLTHSLAENEIGCAVSFDTKNSAAVVVIKKLDYRTTEIPVLTLYTKKPCPLCDELKEELKSFEGQFLLKEVDIESEENKVYYDLYKYEIPVLYLNGRFLCKHKLNPQQFNRRLSEFKVLVKGMK